MRNGEVAKFAINLIDGYIGNTNWKVNENSNTDYAFQGLNLKMVNYLTEVYWLNKVLPKEVSDAHLQGRMHIHDLGSLASYCCGWDLRRILEVGFTGVPSKVCSAPPKHFSTALDQLVNFLFTTQSEVAGAVAVSNFDTFLAPFIYYDNLEYDEVKQAIQRFVYNMNIATRCGFQCPFSNVTLDLEPPDFMKDEPVLVAGGYKDKTYKEFQAEMNMFNHAFCEVLLEGDVTGKPFSFPIPTYSITKDFDWNNDNLDILWELTSKTGIPYFSNYVNSDMKPEDVRSMCCRLRIDNSELRKRGGGMFGANPNTGSCGVVTINLPRIAYETYINHSNSTKEEQAIKYFEQVDELLLLARRSLTIKRELIEDLTEKGLYPYCKFYLSDVKKATGKYWGNHFSTIGVLGANEACLNLFGKGIEEEEGKNFSIRILNHIREKLEKFQIEDNCLMNLESSPAEGCATRFALKDKEKYPDIIASGEGTPFYTNSTQLPVDNQMDIFEMIEHQDTLQTLYTGGTTLHFHLGERIEDINTLKNLVKRICEVSKMPYFTLSVVYSNCSVHGNHYGIHETCPTCGGKCLVYARIVGYYRPIDAWNIGKKEEFKHRRNLIV